MYRSAKFPASLLSIGKRPPALSSFLDAASGASALAEFLGKAIDNSSTIADRGYTQ